MANTVRKPRSHIARLSRREAGPRSAYAAPLAELSRPVSFPGFCSAWLGRTPQLLLPNVLSLAPAKLSASNEYLGTRPHAQPLIPGRHIWS